MCFFQRLYINPIIEVVKTMKKIGKAMQSSVEIIFLLSGNIFNLKDIVDKVKYNSMTIYIHLDLMEGFSSDYIALKYISEKI